MSTAAARKVGKGEGRDMVRNQLLIHSHQHVPKSSSSGLFLKNCTCGLGDAPH